MGQCKDCKFWNPLHPKSKEPKVGNCTAANKIGAEFWAYAPKGVQAVFNTTQFFGCNQFSPKPKGATHAE